MIWYVHPFLLYKDEYTLKVPLMNCYPEKHSVLVLDNCRIHHTEALREVLEEQGEFAGLNFLSWS